MKKNSLFLTLVIIVSSLFIGMTEVKAKSVTESLKYIPVQDRGRIKPFDSFARETLQLVYGKQKYKGKPAYDVIFTWYLVPDHWIKEKVIQVNHNGLRESLKLDKEETYYTPMQLMQNERMSLFFKELASKQNSGDKLSGYYQAVQRLQSQMSIFQAIRMGHGFLMIPGPEVKDRWRSVAQYNEEETKRYYKMSDAYVATISNLKTQETKKSSDGSQLTAAINEFIKANETNVRANYFDQSLLNSEVSYNNLQPFMWTWILYLLGGVLFLLFFLFKNKHLYSTALVFIIGGFLLHSYGFGIRVYLAGRPPVANMYETLLWVPWGAIFFALILEKIRRTNLLLFVASIAATLCMIITSLAPNVFDPSLQPLEPVLKSSFWLTTHVLIITISYGAFFLAWGIGNIMMLFYLKGEEKHQAFLKESAETIYKTLQIGIVLLAAGIILGGIWADYSWGRFWGWDPKETWALIALLGYLALLHGRLVGWVKNFAMGAGSILAFSLVIMAWYGVNYVLGAGLHSYGFGVGGVEYVAFAIFVQFLFVAVVAVLRRSRK